MLRDLFSGEFSVIDEVLAKQKTSSSPITTPAGAAGAWAAEFCVTVASLLTRAKARASFALAGSFEVSGFV